MERSLEGLENRRVWRTGFEREEAVMINQDRSYTSPLSPFPFFRHRIER
jgi:hypothetical protein